MDKLKEQKVYEIIEKDLIPLRAGATSTQQENIRRVIKKACEEALKYQEDNDAYVVTRKSIAEESKQNTKHAKKAAQELENLVESYKINIGDKVYRLVLKQILERMGVVEVEIHQETMISSKGLSITEDLIHILKNVASEDDDLSLTQQGCIDFGSRSPIKNERLTRDDSAIAMTGRGMNRDYKRHSLAFNLRLIIEKWRDEVCVDFSAQEGDRLSDNNFIGNKVLSDIATTVIPDSEEDMAKDVYRGPSHYKDMFSLLIKNYPRASFTPYLLIEQGAKNKKKT